jgi:hypothetical protein
MSTVTWGPAVVLDGPLPEAPPHSLLNVPGVLIEGESERWLNGATVYGYPPSTPESWDPCATGTFRDKAEGDPFPIPQFGSFVAYLPITCSAMSIGEPDDFAQRAERAMEATESFAVERALSQGVAFPSSNPYFGDANVSILGGGVVTPQVGLSYLENAIGATGRRGMIHATPATVAAWGFGAGVTDDPPVNGLQTASGNPIAAGGGYIGAQPSGGSAAAAGQSWAFATGPVQVRHGDILVPDISEVLERTLNDVTYRAERYELAVWDTALQAAVLIDWSP